jgi:hypothetical protein
LFHRHSLELEQDFSQFLRTCCQNRDHAIVFFSAHIDFVLPRLKDLLVHITLTSKVDIEFHTIHRSLRLFGEIQTEIYLEEFSRCLSILFDCARQDTGTSSILIVHAFEIAEHLLANLDECLLAKVYE